MLINVLTRLAADIGYHKVDKRAALERLLNDGAKELHRKIDCNKIYREVTLVVPANKVVSLPSLVGEIKGMRIHSFDTPAPIYGISYPRYVKNVDDYRFFNWRDLGDSPVHTIMDSVGPLTLTTNIVEGVTVFISAQTNNAAQVEEAIVMDATSKTTLNAFGPQIFSIACASNNRVADILVLDVNGTELATLHNNADKSRYKIVDVSELFPLDTTDEESLIDVCYKLPARNLTRDSDSFYAGDDYDEAWFNMCMALFLRNIPERVSDSFAYTAKAMNDLKAAKSHAERNLIKKISYGPNKFFGLFKRGQQCITSCTDVDRS
jgi:hypothetical protein